MSELERIVTKALDANLDPYVAVAATLNLCAPADVTVLQRTKAKGECHYQLATLNPLLWSKLNGKA